MKELLLIDERTVARLLTLDKAMIAVEQAFVAHALRKGRLFPVVKEKYSDQGSFSLKSGVMLGPDTLGVKAAGSWRCNPARGLPTVQATVLLVDPDTGEPLALIAGKTLTTMRTGAAGGVAARLLARRDAAVLGVVGTGVQGEIQTEAVLAVRPSIRAIVCCNPQGPVPERFTDRFKDRVRVSLCSTPGEVAREADIIITATPSSEPLIDANCVRTGTHINAMGTDSPGKREIGPDLLRRATRFVDSADQARAIGEHQYAQDLPVVEIGSLLSQPEIFRRGSDEVTLFDSTGIAFQDLAAARQVYDLAVAAGDGLRVKWPS